MYIYIYLVCNSKKEIHWLNVNVPLVCTGCNFYFSWCAMKWGAWDLLHKLEYLKQTQLHKEHGTAREKRPTNGTFHIYVFLLGGQRI